MTEKKLEKAPRMVRSGEESPALSDAQIDDARKLIGVWLRRDVHTPAIHEPLSVHDIRRWAQYSVGDDNPLFSDVDYAKRTRWGRIIAPPTFSSAASARPSPWSTASQAAMAAGRMPVWPTMSGLAKLTTIRS